MLTTGTSCWNVGRTVGQHHVRRQRLLDAVEELRPRERALLDQPIGLRRRGRRRLQLVLLIRGADPLPPPCSIAAPRSDRG